MAIPARDLNLLNSSDYDRLAISQTSWYVQNTCAPSEMSNGRHLVLQKQSLRTRTLYLEDLPG